MKHLGWIIPVALAIIGWTWWVSSNLYAVKMQQSVINERQQKIVHNCCPPPLNKLEYVGSSGLTYYKEELTNGHQSDNWSGCSDQ